MFTCIKSLVLKYLQADWNPVKCSSFGYGRGRIKIVRTAVVQQKKSLSPEPMKRKYKRNARINRHVFLIILLSSFQFDNILFETRSIKS